MLYSGFKTLRRSVFHRHTLFAARITRTLSIHTRNNNMIFEQNPDDPTWWTDTDCLFGECESVELTVVTDGSSPDDATVDELSAVAKEANKYIHAAAELILENYSREHFASLGIDESLLVNETVDEVANAVTLRSMLVTDAAEKTFEMSFTAPWDSHHSFDVEFENGDAETCAVNG